MPDNATQTQSPQISLCSATFAIQHGTCAHALMRRDMQRPRSIWPPDRTHTQMVNPRIHGMPVFARIDTKAPLGPSSFKP
jgi:hypothetical protein